MLINNKSYRTIWYDKSSESVKIIDQTKLPFKLEVISLKKADDVIKAINEMKVRGAPLIGATAAYGIFLAYRELKNKIAETKSRIDAFLLNQDPRLGKLAEARLAIIKSNK